jgi:hypothetical protein
MSRPVNSVLEENTFVIFSKLVFSRISKKHKRKKSMRVNFGEYPKYRCQSRQLLNKDVYQLLPLCLNTFFFFVTRVCENLNFSKDVHLLIVQVSVANTTIEISKENFYRLGKVLLPPEPEVLARSVDSVLHGHAVKENRRGIRKGRL